MKSVLSIFGLMLVLVFGVMVTFGDPAPTQGTGTGGPVFVSGDDAEDHCGGTNCGSLYVEVLNSAINLSQSPGSGILAISMGEQDNVDALNSWNNPANGGPNVSITTVTGAAITTAVFSNFDVIFVPSNERDGSDPRGISDADLALLNARQADLVDFVNNLGGGLIALTEQDADPLLAFGFLPVPLQFQNVDYFDAEPTAALAALAPNADSNNLDHDSWHNIWTGPPGFSGLDVLAVTPEVLDNGNPSAAILGGAQVILEPSSAATGCNDDGDDDEPSNPEPVDGPDSEENDEIIPGDRNEEVGDPEDKDPSFEQDDDADCARGVGGETQTPEPCPSVFQDLSADPNCCPDESNFQGELFICICPDSAGGDISAEYICSCNSEPPEPLDCLCQLGGTIPPCNFARSLSADADCDGDVTPLDAYATLVVLSGFEGSGGCGGGDADCNDAVDAKDTLAILAVVAGLEEAATC